MTASIAEIINILKFDLLKENTLISDLEVLIDTLLTDSRNLHTAEGTLFFAINTPGGNDGHKFISPLLEKGVRNFVVEKIPEHLKDNNNINFIVVRDVIEALARIGALGKKNADKIIAVTGSRGKTTVKELIFQLLEPIKKISRSPRSYNSKIGVPLSLWGIQPDSDLAIIEAGISRYGEMSHLRDCIQPETVIFTNIGEDHSEGFRSIEEKASEKVVLALAPSVKKVIFNNDDKILFESLKDLSPSIKKFSWSLEDSDADLWVKSMTSDNSGLINLEFSWSGMVHKISFRTQTKYDLENILTALTFILSEGIDPALITGRIEELHNSGTRLNVSEGINGCSLIIDSFTGDFSSLLPAIDFMRRRKTPYQSLTLIMSDIMHETDSIDLGYKKIAATVDESGIDKFIGIGEEFYARKDIFKTGSQFYRSIEDFLNNVSPGDFIDELILLKGSSNFDFQLILRQLELKNHETVLEVNLDSIVSNYNYFRSKIPSETGIVAMVKASGYGVGSYEIAKTLQDCGASYLAVAVLDEGIDLRRRGITMPIMVMNPKSANYKAMFANRLEPEIYSLSMLRDVISEAERNNIRKYPIHVKLDTGMHRMGFLDRELPMITDMAGKTESIRISSVFSHLATADCLDMNDYTELQLSRFKEMTDYLSQRIPYHFKRHILNSAGILRFPSRHYELVRLGIGLYGVNTLPPDCEKPLASVATLRTIIISIREWDENETVGYGRKGVLKKRSKIATIPIGYADGLDRHLGNGNLFVKVNGKEAPTIGNICMDATMIDVTGIDCKEGDSVVIFGEDAPIQRMADTLDTIPYEILTSVSPRVKRIYFRE
ncbi:MAG: bifunctional UDP-N-acetylmuramoyl-tripeptide:D-alanyl-D-alanine ligase/alanine racemase [Muribaculaceae bacterium]|nr:bifunctional UDP-N-acetylmuramoyl-tripeptide:D-alanyl-D-alanine ligase/alanine racemase [Muribaculaceae bacterium]